MQLSKNNFMQTCKNSSIMLIEIAIFTKKCNKLKTLQYLKKNAINKKQQKKTLTFKN